MVVCGGGTAGISAACCAARHGAKVILLERWPSLGGMATNALVNIWHTSDRTKQVIHGFVAGGRRSRRAVRASAGRFPQAARDARVRLDRHADGVRPHAQRRRRAGLLQPQGGRIRRRGRTASRPCWWTRKTGRKAVRGKIFIDATGDGDIAANAGLPFDFGRASDGRVQGMTMMFRLRGLDAAASGPIREDAQRVFELMKKLRDEGKFPQFLESAARSYLAGPRDPLVSYNMCPVAGNPFDEEELTRLTAQARRQVYQYVDLWRKEMPGFEQAEVEQMGFALGVRESRRIRGLKTLDAQMVVKAVKQPDAIGHGFWMIDIHDPKGSGHTTWVEQKAETMPPGRRQLPHPAGHLPERPHRRTWPSWAAAFPRRTRGWRRCDCNRIAWSWAKASAPARRLALDAGVDLAGGHPEVAIHPPP